MNPLAYLEMASFESRHWWFVRRRRILESLLSSLALQQGAKVLEIGCDTGGNLRMLSKFGTVSAMEMDAIAIDIAKEKAGDICRTSPIERSIAPGQAGNRCRYATSTGEYCVQVDIRFRVEFTEAYQSSLRRFTFVRAPYA